MIVSGKGDIPDYRISGTGRRTARGSCRLLEDAGLIPCGATRERSVRKVRSGLIVFCLLSVVAVAHAAESPEAVVRAFALAMQADGPAATVPRFTHPDECARFKQILMPRIRRDGGVANPNPDKMILRRTLPVSEIEVMPPAEFMSAFFKSHDMRVDGLKFKPPRFLGSVREGDVVHLKIRTEVIGLDGVAVTRTNVVSLKPLGNTWRMLLSPELESLARVLAAQ
jgi:hypothetical protein